MFKDVKTLLVLLRSVCFVGWSISAAGQQSIPQPNGNASHPLGRNVIINGVRLSDPELAEVESKYRIRIQNGSYWYDNISSAWGIEGGPTLGFGVAGLKIGGKLRANASNGNTKVFINGRELHALDVIALRQLGPVYPGHYWVDAYGNCGFEGGPAFVNLVQLTKVRAAQASGTSVGGAWSYFNGNSWVGGDGNGGMFFQGKDAAGHSLYYGK